MVHHDLICGLASSDSVTSTIKHIDGLLELVIHSYVLVAICHVCFAYVVDELVEVILAILQVPVIHDAHHATFATASFLRVDRDVKVELAADGTLLPLLILLLLFLLFPITTKHLALLREKWAVVSELEAVLHF